MAQDEVELQRGVDDLAEFEEGGVIKVAALCVVALRGGSCVSALLPWA